MSDTFDKLKALLAEKKNLTSDEVTQQEAATGPLTDEEKLWLESEKLKLQRSAEATITLEQYLEATKVLDNTPEDSDEHKAALAIVEKYESGM